MPAVLWGVGVGPGDPELLTLKALRVLRSAATVFLPVAEAGTVGRAEAVLQRAGLLDDLERTGRVRRLVFSMTADPARTEPHWKAAAVAVADALPEGSDTAAAFATLGDPNVYSTFTAVAAAVNELRPDVRIETVPGIMALQDLAARSGGPLVSGDQALALVPALDGLPGLDDALARFDAVAVYKAGRRLPGARAAIAAAGRLGDAVLGADLGGAAQRIVAADGIPDGPAEYFSTILVRRGSATPAGAGHG